MFSRLLSGRSRPRRPGSGRGRLWILGLLLVLVSLACETRHRSAVLVPVGFDASSDALASAGILRRADSGIDEGASRLLADASRAPDVSAALTPADRDRLLVEPFRMVYATEWRRDLQQRTGHRRLLVGEFVESRIETRVDWLPIFLVWATPPFELARRTDVPHPAFALRVVDLETGRIDAEFFAMLSGRAARDGLSEAQLEVALAAMGLRGDRR